MEVYEIKEKRYILGTDFMAVTPVYSRGCRNPSELVIKKELKEVDNLYIHARVNKKDGKWYKGMNLSNKLDKIFFYEDFCMRIEEFTQNRDRYLEMKEEINIKKEKNKRNKIKKIKIEDFICVLDEKEKIKENEEKEQLKMELLNLELKKQQLLQKLNELESQLLI